jgi:hypothetical protein
MPASHRSRNVGIVAASLAVHAAVLAVLALHAPQMRILPSEPGQPTAIIPILIMPRVPPPAAAPGAKPAPIRLHRRPQRFAVEPLPLKPLVAPSTEQGPRAAPSEGPRVLAIPSPEETAAANARKALRGKLGCGNANLLNLSPAEREACERELARGAKDAPFLGLGIDRDKASDLGRIAARREADYNYKRGGMPAGVTRGNSAEDLGRITGSDKPTLTIPF